MGLAKDVLQGITSRQRDPYPAHRHSHHRRNLQQPEPQRLRLRVFQFGALQPQPLQSLQQTISEGRKYKRS